ncbi:AAA family ATPase [Streptomyces sp. NPDC004111]|uniref:AAA family ATPase n=1 Tax=Streptomyces sp. NPDC004111 TaxID=3364690 RepID=UPI00367E7380
MTDAPVGHYLNLVGATLVETEALRITLRDVHRAARAQAMACIHGDVGLGKTLAVTRSLQTLDQRRTIRLDLRKGASASELRTVLFRTLGLPGDPPERPLALDNLLTESFAQKPTVLLCDEAQGLSPKALDYLRTLWDREATQLTILFVGGENCRLHLLKRDALASRMVSWQQYTPLTPDEVRDFIPGYHPVWADVSPQDLLWVDDIVCHGNFRNWAKTTFHLQDELTGSPELGGFSRQLLTSILNSLDSTYRTQPTTPNPAGYM